MRSIGNGGRGGEKRLQQVVCCRAGSEIRGIGFGRADGEWKICIWSTCFPGQSALYFISVINTTTVYIICAEIMKFCVCCILKNIIRNGIAMLPYLRIYCLFTKTALINIVNELVSNTNGIQILPHIN